MSNDKILQPRAGMTLEEIQDVVSALGMPRFVAKQLTQWIYQKRVNDFDEMLNISKANRELLASRYCVGLYPPSQAMASEDCTVKYLFDVGDKRAVESVYIPEDDRATLCISCQKGCKMGCSFCVTGRQGFHGSLSASDILNQLFSIPESQRLTNVVFMGMGEPMDNYEAVRQSLEVLTSSWGLAWSPQRITVSTVGIIPSLRRLLDETRCHVAVSLHNAVPAERERLMPVERAYPISDVVALLRQYDWHGQRRISFEYIMFRGINDDIAHAAALLNLLRGLPCRVNLIRFHASPDMPYRTSSDQAIDSFSSYLNSHGITCTLRASRGEDIMAACGLLAGKMKDSEKRI